MTSAPSFAVLLGQLRRQDNTAALEVLRRYQGRLLRLARKQVQGPLRQKLDPEDVVQSVFRTLFRRLAQGQFELGDWDGLWGLLTCITLRKCGRWHDYFRAQARDLRREVAPPPGAPGAWAVFDREPAPEEAAVLVETLEHVLRGLPEGEQQAVTLTLEGVSLDAVSRTLGYSQSKVYRVLQRVRERLERLHDEAKEAGSPRKRPPR
jgi:RNA polymerase sigma-70 factor (ECF subfamily)